MVFYEGLQTADPTTAALILALTPVMTSILAVFILNEPLTAKLVIGGELLLLECFCNWCWAEVCLFRRVNMDFYNDAIFFFIYRFNSEIGEQRRYVFDYILFFNFWFLIMLPFLAFTFSHITLKYSIESWSLLIVTAILMHGICTLAWNNQLRKAQASTAAMFLNLEPFVTMVVGYIILQKSVTAIQIIGAVLSFVECTLRHLDTGRNRRDKSFVSKSYVIV